MDVSTFVLSRALPDVALRLQELVAQSGQAADQRYVFAEISDVLMGVGAAELAATVWGIDLAGLSPFARNYVAALVEQACALRGVAPPAWTDDVAPLDLPWFAADLTSLRSHLLRASPVPFRRRNLFIDAGVDARV